MTIIVTGAGGMLGKAVVAAAKAADLVAVGLTHNDLDITDERALEETFSWHGEDPTVINCAGIVRGRYDRWTDAALHVNSVAPFMLAARCARLVHVSTDCVFDGVSASPYSEFDAPAPTDWYGETKLAGEVYGPAHVTVRGSFIGFDHGLLAWLLAQPEGARIPGYEDHSWSGTYVADFADALVELAGRRHVCGVVHLPGDPTTKGKLLVELTTVLRPDVVVEHGPGPDGPRHMNLTSIRTGVPRLPEWHDSLTRLARDHAVREMTRQRKRCAT